MGQKELAQRIYEAGSQGHILIAEAMSGFGKTAAALAGSLSAAEDTGCGVVYACRTKRQIQRVVEEASRLQKKHQFRASSIFSKFDYCLLKRDRVVPRESFGWYCSFNTSNNLCSYFMNVPLIGEGLDSIVERALLSTPSHAALVSESESIHVCPYEAARLILAQSDFAVVPYHYAFDQKGTMLFGDGSRSKKRTILVVDEAHNLRDFFRGLGSATLTLGHVRGAIDEARALLMEEAERSLGTLLRVLERANEGRSGWRLDKTAIIDEIRGDQGTGWLQNLAFELNSCSGAAWGSVAYERRLPSLILEVGDFLTRLSSSPESVLVNWEGKFGLVNPNPVSSLEQVLKGFASSILMSATLNPSAVFMKSLGLRPDTASYEVSADPFVEVETIVDTGVSTKYKLRTPEMFAKISERIAAVVRETGSGVGVFTPSYSILKTLHETTSGLIGDKVTVSEAPGLTSQQAFEVFESFESAKGAVMFAVQGGRFSEGEDFHGASMGAVVVVGLSLPPPTPLLHAEYAYMKTVGEPDSYLMLSRLPALRKAFQAAGRHIRSPGKRGLVVLMDWRFSSEAVVDLMPPWLKKDLVTGDFGPEGLARLTKQFWLRGPRPPSPS